LAEDGIKAQPTEFSPWGLRIEGRPQLQTSTAFRDGLVEPQDEASQLAALAVGAKPGMRVLDYCAGAGGKALAIAGMMRNKGELLLHDNDPRRLGRSEARLARAGVEIARVTSNQRDLRAFGTGCDRVLVDAPCSATGRWRREPDIRLPEENQDVVDAFLRAEKGFTLIDLESYWPVLEDGPAPSAGPFLTLTPKRHGTDGFFVALVQRTT
jgi:16S rRNA (cytosine967-C5)-methyltransferase